MSYNTIFPFPSLQNKYFDVHRRSIIEVICWSILLAVLALIMVSELIPPHCITRSDVTDSYLKEKDRDVFWWVTVQKRMGNYRTSNKRSERHLLLTMVLIVSLLLFHVFKVEATLENTESKSSVDFVQTMCVEEYRYFEKCWPPQFYAIGYWSSIDMNRFWIPLPQMFYE